MKNCQILKKCRLQYIGKKLRLARLCKNLTQEQLGSLLNVQKTTISKIEAGKMSLEINLVIEICNILHLTYEQLLPKKEISEDIIQKEMNDMEDKIYSVIFSN